jgi:dTMP kinase
MQNLRNELQGSFLVFDGPDGAGKSSVRDWFARHVKALFPDLPVVQVREPGGTEYGEQIRELLLNYKPITGEPLHPRTEVLLFMAARQQLLENVVCPELKKGALVLSDRFVSSTLAYQGTAGQVPVDDIITVAKAVIPAWCWPKITVILDVTYEKARERMAKKPQELDRIEKRGRPYWELTRTGYLMQASRWPQYTLLVDANAAESDVRQQVLDKVTQRLRDLSNRIEG